MSHKHTVFHEKNVQRLAAKSVQHMSPYIKYLPLSLQFHVVKKHGERASKEGKEKHFNGEKERYLLLPTGNFSLIIVKNLKMYM